MPKEYKNILVHAIMNLGDVVLATSVVPIIKEKYPEAKITFMVRSGLTAILENSDLIDEVIGYDYKSKGDYFNVYKFGKQLKKYNFDLSISLDSRFRLALVTWFAGIPERTGCYIEIFSRKKTKAHYLFTKTITFEGYNMRSGLRPYDIQEIVRRILNSNSSLNVPFIGQPFKEDLDHINNIISKIPKHKMLIGFCVNTNFALKNWPRERFTNLIKQVLKKYDAHIIITGIDADKKAVEDILAPIQDESSIINLCAKTSLKQMVALFKQLDFMITLDNGTAHVAAATELPLVTIFGCTSPIVAKPLTKYSFVVGGDIECALKCSKSANECPKHECMQRISVDEVMKSVDEIVATLKSINKL